MLTLLARLPGPFRSIAERFDRTPIDSVERLNLFARTRASYVAQTALFDYLKARMGTQFRDYFMDDEFSRAIQDSSGEGVRVQPVGPDGARRGGRRGNGSASGAPNRRRWRGRVLRSGNARRPFRRRRPEKYRRTPEAGSTGGCARSTGARPRPGDAAFALSPADLVRYAPVIDEFKQLDRGIVATSVGHKWREVRTAFRDRAVPERIAADWRAASGA